MSLGSYEVTEEVQDLLLEIRLDAYRLIYASQDLNFRKSAPEEFFHTIVSIADTIAKEANIIRQKTYGRSEE